jgi:hypothetical protein
MKHMVCDISNLFWRSVAAQQKKGALAGDDAAGLGLHMSLLSLRKHWNAIQPDKLAVVFEGKENWRKDYTRSAKCYSRRLYKGNRVADPSMAVLFDVMRAFEDLVRKHTNIITLQHPILEGDDLIAGYAQHYSALGDEVIILSGDKDFVQLLGDPNIKLINPDDGHERTLLEVCDVQDAGYFMFEKCIRGDSGDNVLPAFPRVRKTKLYKAFGVQNGKVDTSKADAFEMLNIMNSEWEFVDSETGEKRQMSVQKLYDENTLLMNLYAQPPYIREKITEVITYESANCGSFNLFSFCQFLGKYKLMRITEKSADFIPMLSGTRTYGIFNTAQTVFDEKVKRNSLTDSGFNF